METAAGEANRVVKSKMAANKDTESCPGLNDSAVPAPAERKTGQHRGSLFGRKTQPQTALPTFPWITI